MNRTKFIEQLLKIDVAIDAHSESGCPWGLYERYADLTGLIDFQCDFMNGQCKMNNRYNCPDSLKDDKHRLRSCESARRRKQIRLAIRSRQMCCCRGCYGSIGYLRAVNHNDIDMIAKHFKPEIGFWRKDGGCVLPRRKRSAVCLGYSCVTVKKTKGCLEILEDVLKTPWVSTYNPPEFIDAYGWDKEDGRRRRRWLTPSELEQMIISKK